MLLNWMASFIDWWKSPRRSSSLPQMDSQPGSESTLPDDPPIVSSETFWSRFTGTSRLRRRLESELAREREARMMFEGQVIAMREELVALRAELSESLKNERIGYHSLVNAHMQTRYGFAPYPNAPKIPDSYAGFDNTQVESEYVHIRSLQDSARADFKAKFRNAVTPRQDN